jgi:hypothetical protein
VRRVAQTQDSGRGCGSSPVRDENFVEVEKERSKLRRSDISPEYAAPAELDGLGDGRFYKDFAPTELATKTATEDLSPAIDPLTYPLE